MGTTLITKKDLLKKLDITTEVLNYLVRHGMPKDEEMFDFAKVISWREEWSKKILGNIEVGEVFTNKEIAEKFKCSM
ncbi:hypothetical protein ACLM5A_02170 [Enterococcus hirae]